MEFSKFRTLVQNKVNSIISSNNCFDVDINKDEFWELYLDSFPQGTNEIYRTRREYDCSCCRQFIKNVGGLISISNGKIDTIWDIDFEDNTFTPVCEALSRYVKSKEIFSIFARKERQYGVNENFEHLENGGVKKYEHFCFITPQSILTDSVGSIQGRERDIRNVFKRSLDEISIDSVETVLELISQNSIYRGEEWKQNLQTFLKFAKEYSLIENKELYCWEKYRTASVAITNIRNHSMGTLLLDITNNIELDIAVKKYEAIVAPTNYKRPKAIFTKKMLESAKQKISELGYLTALERRYANKDDININNVLFTTKSQTSKTESDLFSDLEKSVTVSHKNFSKVQEISIDNFITEVLPTTSKLEVLLQNKHCKNLMSLIAPTEKDSNSMFKWNNNFSWSYNGNITDSDLKSNVKKAGGKVDGVLRCSLQWNDITRDSCDLDLHCTQPNGQDIFYGDKIGYTYGQLDVDIIHPIANTPSVENITWNTTQAMKNGDYKFFIHEFSGKPKHGFRAEIEFDGQIYQYNLPKRLNTHTPVATVHYHDNQFTITHHIEPTSENINSKEIWNLKTETFIPVNTMMLSPNYWDEQMGNGNKHYFFMLENCKREDRPNGFFNEFLKEDLLEHKRVFEALGNTLKIEDTDNQLSGLGFSSTQANELIVKVKGKTTRILKIKF